MPEETKGFGTRVWNQVKARFEIDTRALAVMRISLGVLILVDLFYRSLNLTAHYTDHGVYPRTFLSWVRPDTHQYVLHGLSGEPWFIAALFVLQALFAVALIVGFRTRLVTIISFLLLLSLHTRNTFILNAGDTLMRLILFWAIFLPLGDRWSLDAHYLNKKKWRVADFATAAILVQVVIVYVLNAYHKIQSGYWASGEALQYIFHIDRFMTPLGQTFNAFPEILSALTKTWYYMVIVSPLLLLVTGWARTILAGMFAGAHLSMFILMQIGVFPLVSVVSLLPFVHKKVWDLFEHRVVQPVFRTRFKGWLLTVSGWVQTPRDEQETPEPTQEPAPTPAPAPGPNLLQRANLLVWVPRVRSTLVFVLLAGLVASAGVTAGLMTLPEDIEKEFNRREKRWSMFATPARWDQWIVAPATLESGEYVDALHLDNKTWSEPRYVESPYPDLRWRKYLDALVKPNRDAMLTEFGDYLCKRWNDNNEDKMEYLFIYRVTQRINLDGEDPEPRRSVLKQHWCE